MANKSKNIVKVSIVFLLTYIVLSAMAILPEKLSIPVPELFQTYNSLYYFTGYSYEKKFKDEIDETIIEKGTFDSLNLFDNGNIKNGSYYDADKQCYYLHCGEVCKKLTTKKAKDIFNTRYSYKGTIVKVDDYYYGFDEEDIYVFMSKDACSKFGRIEFEDACTVEEYKTICNLLEKQRNEDITPFEFASLIGTVSQDILVYWNSEEHEAIFKTYINGGNEYMLTKFQTESLDSTEYGPFKDSQYQFVVSSSMNLYFDSSDKSVKVYDFTENKLIYTLHGADLIKHLNFQFVDNNLLIAVSTTNNQIHWRYVSDGTITEEFQYGDFSLENTKGLIFGDNQTLVFTTENGVNCSYSYFTSPEIVTVDEQEGK